jgi:hypothetical protein
MFRRFVASPPSAAKYFFQDADFDGFAKQNHQNQRLEKYSLAASAAKRF